MADEELDNIKKATEAQQRYLDFQKASAETMARLTRQNSKAAIDALKAQEAEVLKLSKLGQISYQTERQLIEQNKADRKMAEEATGSTFSKAIKGFKEDWLDLGSVLQKTGYGAIAIFALAQIDAQRRLSQLAGSTFELFNKQGRDLGEAFGSEFTTTWTKYPRLIADNMRGEFLTSIMALGTPIKEISAANFEGLADQLIILGKAFNISSDQMATMLFDFQDILGHTTGQAGKDIQQLANTALSLQVAPQRLLTLSENLINTFKLQKVSLQEVAEVFVTFRRNAQLGVEVTQQLTENTVTALANLKESNIAGLLALTTGASGTALGSSLVDFFKIGGKDVSSRLDLALKGLNALETKFPAVMQNELARTRLVMQTFGVSDFSTGVQLLNALESGNKNGSLTVDATKKATEILQGTTGYMQQINNVIQNLLGRGFAWLIRIGTALFGGITKLAGFTGMFGDVQDISKRMTLMNQRADELTKLNDALVKNDTESADIARKHLEVLDLAEANLSTNGQVAKQQINQNNANAAASMGLFDTMNDHLGRIKENTLATAVASKGILESAATPTGPMGIKAVTPGVIEALKTYTKLPPLDIKITSVVEDKYGVFKSVGSAITTYGGK